MEERGENGRKHVLKKCWTKHIENPRKRRKQPQETVEKAKWKKSCDNIRKTAYKLGNARNNQRKRCRKQYNMEETRENARRHVTC